MATEQLELGSAIVQLLPVVVGGLLTVLGAVAGPPFVHWLQQRAEGKKRRTEKFEEMVSTLYEHEHWLDVVRQKRMFGDAAAEPPSPLPKARVIAAIYFPQFSEALAEIEQTSAAFGLWALGAARKRLENNLAGINEGISEAYQPYREKFLRLIIALQEYAKKEFRT